MVIADLRRELKDIDDAIRALERLVRIQSGAKRASRPMKAAGHPRSPDRDSAADQPKLG
jgi:hypothetical protein